jgi:hypothetical protein
VADTVTVSAADVAVVKEVLFTAFAAFGATLQHVPHVGDAIEACTRMAGAAIAAQMPEDPVSDSKGMAIVYHELFREFIDAEFDDHQAFELVKIHAQAVEQLGLMRLARG